MSTDILKVSQTLKNTSERNSVQKTWLVIPDVKAF
jgi:hypothetical protein